MLTIENLECGYGKLTVLRGPHIDKKSREQFELSAYSRLLDIDDSNAKTVDALMKLYALCNAARLLSCVALCFDLQASNLVLQLSNRGRTRQSDRQSKCNSWMWG